MQITLNLDKETLDRARDVADSTGEELTDVLTRVLRQGFGAKGEVQLVYDELLGIHIFPNLNYEGNPFTLDLIARLRDDGE